MLRIYNNRAALLRIYNNGAALLRIYNNRAALLRSYNIHFIHTSRIQTMQVIYRVLGGELRWASGR